MSPSSLAAILEICKYNISLHIWHIYNIHMLYFSKYAYNKYTYGHIFISQMMGQFSMGRVNIL